LKITEEQQRPIVELVEAVLSKQKRKENTSILEKAIGKQIYELYNLTDEEIFCIEN
jgi:hypothetical protein